MSCNPSSCRNSAHWCLNPRQASNQGPGTKRSKEPPLRSFLGEYKYGAEKGTEQKQGQSTGREPSVETRSRWTDGESRQGAGGEGRAKTKEAGTVVTTLEAPTRLPRVVGTRAQPDSGGSCWLPRCVSGPWAEWTVGHRVRYPDGAVVVGLLSPRPHSLT